MNDDVRRLRRRAVMDSVQKGIDKAFLLLGRTITSEERQKLLEFVRNADSRLTRFKNDREETDIDLHEFFPAKLSETLATRLEKRVGIRTVQDLVISCLPTLREGMKHGRVHFQEVLLAMRPNVIAKKSPRVRKPVEKVIH